MNVLSAIRKRFASHSLPSPARPCLQENLPKVRSCVPGFRIQVERMGGCVLRGRPNGSSEDTPYTDIGVDEHFKVAVVCDGNHHFPDAKGPWTFLLTNGKDEKSGCGFSGRVHFQPLGDTFTRVEVVEKYEDYRDHDGEILMGPRRKPKPEMVVWVKIHARQANGRESSSGCGIASRPAVM